MARNAEMTLPEQRAKPKSIVIKPVPGKPLNEKVLRQRDGDFVVLKPIPAEPEVAQKKVFKEAVGQKRPMPSSVRKKNSS